MKQLGCSKEKVSVKELLSKEESQLEVLTLNRLNILFDCYKNM